MAHKLFTPKSASSLLTATLFATLLLAGCGDDSADTAADDTSSATEEVEASEPKEEKEEAADEPTEEELKAEEEAAAKEAAEEAAAAEKKAAEEAAAAEKKAEEEAEAEAARIAAEEEAAAEALASEEAVTYAANMGEHIGALSDNLLTLSDLSFEAGEDTSLMFDSDWIASFAMELVLMDLTIEAVRAETPPEQFEEAHATVLKSMDEFEFVVDNMPTAIDNLDWELIEESTVHMGAGSDYMMEATEQIEALYP